MLLIHDIVEIDAGDTFCYGDQSGKAGKEQAAATRIFGLLPASLAPEFTALWEEFENMQARMYHVVEQLQQVHARLAATAVTADRLFSRMTVSELPRTIHTHR